jgi:hypothetical protein
MEEFISCSQQIHETVPTHSSYIAAMSLLWKYELIVSMYSVLLDSFCISVAFLAILAQKET